MPVSLYKKRDLGNDKAKAGIHVRLSNMDPRFRGDDCCLVCRYCFLLSAFCYLSQSLRAHHLSLRRGNYAQDEDAEGGGEGESGENAE